MTWEQFFLGCFAFGFVLSLVGFLAGSAHLHFHMHHGHVHGHGGGRWGFQIQFRNHRRVPDVVRRRGLHPVELGQDRPGADR